ncbi:uncharacterized protein ACA1_387340 [Acanthamoeba castellanii str. Neff]|uniref:Uncharacterized protein n=1 Tax=Acanthamoeba castellanii (strain ATCC 30010 / Neff) TaxID=1257118 RepID=L8GDC9_ACACF|nr:uncharacterized protein ACA1_387340 [Acanthamoeba castellanii str. Neff]ELR11135.1 hypothetical protein ACA1_387340 [Acanthamoeba castellanii str. Neff]
MGNLQVIKQKATAEYERTDTILREYPIDLTHLGILFMLDRSRRCRFYLEDIMRFIDLCYEREQGNRESHELQQMILNVKRAYGMSTQDFYFLMQRAAEEANLMTLDEHFDNWIPTDIVQDFVREFMKGFQNFMTQLGFEPGVELK